MNYGYTDAVNKDTARSCGAKGGTVIGARWAGSRTGEEEIGAESITLQEEKEILAIVASRKEQAHIMEEMDRLHGVPLLPSGCGHWSSH